ncbi:2'-5' RNA ligase family protein [Luedemannella helvata]|uniref:2'-5' RNA ligase family protein n=1 Tax=Luedemannella helvata TaxID=349315 RepID=A0ABP4VTQ1_9ACTN
MGDTVVRTIGVAFGIPAPWGPELDRFRAASGDPLAGNMPAHVTLLGPTELGAATLDETERHLAAVARAHPPFRLRLQGTGTFRPVTQVVFVAIADGAAECARLADDVRSGPLDRELAYPYHPHVTVAHDVPPLALDTVYADLAAFEAEFEVASFTLYEHTAEGRWRPERHFALTGP